MMPASSRRFRRSQAGAADRLTRLASSAFEIRPSRLRMDRILRSRSSSFSIHASGHEGGTDAMLAREFHGKGRDRRVLRAGPGQVTDGDLVVGVAARKLPGQNLAQFRRRSLLPKPGLDCTAEFPQLLTLADAIADIEVCFDQRGGIDFVLTGLVGAHGGDVEARM